MKEITVENLAKELKANNALVIDIREDYEFQVGHIQGNVLHIPMDEVESKIQEFDKSKATYIMCRSGKRAAALTNYLCTNYDYPNLGYVLGGIEAYANEIDSSIEVQH